MKHDNGASSSHTGAGHGQKSHYGRLGIMTALSFVAMYVLMYAMVDVLDNVL